MNERYRGPDRRRRERAEESQTELLWFDQGVLPTDDEGYYDEYDEYDDHEYDDHEYDDEYEEDEYDEYAGDGRAAPEYYEDDRSGPRSSGRKRRGVGGRALRWGAAIAVIVVLAAGAYVGGRELLGIGYDDYTGAGEADTIIHVSEGDTTRQIALTLAEADVVASAEAFLAAGKDNGAVRSVQPGYYLMKKKSSGENAVERIVADSTRVGHFTVRPGLQLDDVTKPDGSKSKGLLSRLSQASCAGPADGSSCVSPRQLRKAIAGADLAALGVPKWAADDAASAAGARKLEGLIAPGHYDVRPGSSAEELWQRLLTTSSTRLRAAGLPDAAEGTGHDPYEVLIVASMIQREGITQDFGKISRVVYNRLAQGMKLGLDSTINYVQDTPTVRTSPEERAKEGPYNTYRNTGLVPSPISAPSDAAIEAAANPPDGEWMYFVKCESNGKSCFSTSYSEHERKAADARDRGVY